MYIADLIRGEIDGSFAGTSAPVAMLRLFAALALGAIIGIEREVKARPAGLRTHMLISVAACLFSLIAFEIIALSSGSGEGKTTDPLRLIEAVTSGVAFLAAGTIFTSRGEVQGLTTGAGMWMAGAVGLCCGIGQLALAAIAGVGTVAILFLFGAMSDRLRPD